VTILSVTASASDLAETHQRLCSSKAVKSEIGENGACRIVIGASKPANKAGSCIGKFRGVMPCQVDFMTSEKTAAIHLVCGFDPKSPAFDQVIEAGNFDYSVVALVTKSDDTQVMINDEGSHSILESDMMSIILSKYDEETSAIISLNMKTGPEELLEVECK
jgi:hypothetical protein